MKFRNLFAVACAILTIGLVPSVSAQTPHSVIPCLTLGNLPFTVYVMPNLAGRIKAEEHCLHVRTTASAPSSMSRTFAEQSVDYEAFVAGLKKTGALAKPVSASRYVGAGDSFQEMFERLVPDADKYALLEVVRFSGATYPDQMTFVFSYIEKKRLQMTN